MDLLCDKNKMRSIDLEDNPISDFITTLLICFVILNMKNLHTLNINCNINKLGYASVMNLKQ